MSSGPNNDSKQVTLATSVCHTLRVRPVLHLRLPIDPRQASSWDDQFILRGQKEGQASEEVKTVKDDQVPGDGFVDLVYENVARGWSYSLEIDPGAEGEPYFMFEGKAYEDLFR